VTYKTAKINFKMAAKLELYFWFWFCHSLLSSSACDSASAYKFYRNKTTGDAVVTSCRSLRWRQRHRKSTPGFSFGDVSHLRTSKSISIENITKTAQSAAEILLFPVSENKRPQYWNSTSGSTSTFP